MTEEELRNKLQEGFERIKPSITKMTDALMDVYQQGFKDCWELLTNQKL